MKILAIIILVFLAININPIKKNDGQESPVVVVHRGANRITPENTLAAMQKAIAQGADYIEIDVRTSKDGILYCLHDRTLDRTTNGEGLISEHESEYVDQLDAGSWFSSNFKNETVPRVEKLIKQLKEEVDFYFDVKDANLDQLIALIRDEEVQNKCFVWFSDRDKAGEFMKKAPEIAVKMNAQTPQEVLRLVETHQPDIIECNAYNISKKMMAVCKQNNIRLMANILRDSWWEYQKAIEMQVPMVNIDHPDYFQTMISSKNHQFQDYRFVAHRGGIVEDLFAEYDPRSIQAAIDSGYWMLEIDVQASADSIPIVHHDDNLSRIYGTNSRISELTLMELKSLKAKKGGYAPLTLSELAAMCAGKVEFMMDLKADQPWFYQEVKETLEENNMLETSYFISHKLKPYFEKGKYGFRMHELQDFANRMLNDEDVIANYYLFDHGNRINAEAARWCQNHNIEVCASVNIGHYHMEYHEAGAKRDIDYLKDCGVTLFQIDSPYDDFFEKNN